MTVFSNYARYYDLLYRDKDYTGEAKFIHELIQKYAPNAESILELGCGTGKHAELCCQRWAYDVHGIDMSSEMLEAANRRLSNWEEKGVNKLSFDHGDIRTYRTDRCFDAVVSLFHVVSYQTTNKDLQNVFETAKVHLKQGGVFIFDCWYGPAVLSDPPVVRVKRFEDEKIEITRIAEPEMYPNENRVDVHYQVFIKDKFTGRMEILKETHRMRYLFKPEIVQILALSGLSFINGQEWLSGNELDFSTWNGCFIAENK